MRTPVLMPKMGYDMESGKILEWRKEVGQQVSRGEVIAEIEIDKGSAEVESLAAGTLVEILHGAGDEVEVGQPIAYLE